MVVCERCHRQIHAKQLPLNMMHWNGKRGPENLLPTGPGHPRAPHIGSAVRWRR